MRNHAAFCFQARRLSVIATVTGAVVHGSVGETTNLRTLVSDRAADEIGFPGERVVRLPRRLSRVRWYENDSARVMRLHRWACGMPAWPLDNGPPRVLPVEA